MAENRLTRRGARCKALGKVFNAADEPILPTVERTMLLKQSGDWARQFHPPASWTCICGEEAPRRSTSLTSDKNCKVK